MSNLKRNNLIQEKGECHLIITALSCKAFATLSLTQERVGVEELVHEINRNVNYSPDGRTVSLNPSILLPGNEIKSILCLESSLDPPEKRTT